MDVGQGRVSHGANVASPLQLSSYGATVYLWLPQLLWHSSVRRLDYATTTVYCELIHVLLHDNPASNCRL